MTAETLKGIVGLGTLTIQAGILVYMLIEHRRQERFMDKINNTIFKANKQRYDIQLDAAMKKIKDNKEDKPCSG